MDELNINQYWWRVINTMNDALLIIGKEGTILTVNQSFEEMTGYLANEVTGRPCTLLRCDACEKAITNKGDFWCKLFEPGYPDLRRCRCLIVRKDGTHFPALKNASVLYDENGEVLGAVETLMDMSELDRLDKKVAFLSRQLDETVGYHGIIGQSHEMKSVFDLMEKAAAGDAPVVIYGETGTGKDLAARAIHEQSPRREGPYVQVNCAALNESLLESELFGHVRGSFTGAFKNREGRFETANNGTLFLDEIGDLPASVQVKLLRVLETRQFERVGESHPITVNVRIITATNRNLNELIAQNRFREDLYFRINVIPVHLPALRRRKQDIPLLVNTFIKRIGKRSGKTIRGIHPDAMTVLMDHPWPGNVRELKSTLEYAATVADQGLITRGHLPPGLLMGPESEPFATPRITQKEMDEKGALIQALQKTGGNQTKAAAVLGVNRVTVWNRMRKYGVDLKKIVNG